MNGAYAPPLTAPTVFAGRQGATARSAAAPSYYQRGGISVTEDEAYKAAGHAPRRRAACGRWFLTLDARHEVKHGEPGEVRILWNLDDACRSDDDEPFRAFAICHGAVVSLYLFG